MKDHGIIELYDWDTQELFQYVKKYDIFNFKSFIMCVELVSSINNVFDCINRNDYIMDISFCYTLSKGVII